MPRLSLIAVNISDKPSKFVLEAYEQRVPELEQDALETPFNRLLRQDFVTRLESDREVEPGGYCDLESQDLDYDMSRLFWYVPHRYRGLFNLKRFDFGNRPILQKAGVV